MGRHQWELPESPGNRIAYMPAHNFYIVQAHRSTDSLLQILATYAHVCPCNTHWSPSATGRIFSEVYCAN